MLSLNDIYMYSLSLPITYHICWSHGTITGQWLNDENVPGILLNIEVVP